MNCVRCDKPLKVKQRQYCSLPCFHEHLSEKQTDRWLRGEISGLSTIGVVTQNVKNWLRRERGDRCELCGWNKINPVTGKVPLVADHIDGNWSNNRPENLRLICPNCDSLQSTYGALNKGKGRRTRRNVTKEDLQ